MSEEKPFLLQGLNSSQTEAVSAPPCNMLVIAGAGTGKTRVLVYRIISLLKTGTLHPRNLIAVTFTNKAAREIRSRLEEHLDPASARAVWAGTFHSVCLRLLRAYAAQAGLRPGFSVLDTVAQNRLVKRIMEEQKLQNSAVKPQKLAAAISSLKDKQVRADAYLDNPRRDETGRMLEKIYPIYEETCYRESLVDFSEILLRTVELLAGNRELRELQHRRFREILVDEFQDTSAVQYKFLRLVTGRQSHVMAVGDDDQSIYGWRGADYGNMTQFLKDFAPVKQVSLQYNYRSVQHILDVANTVIRSNSERIVIKNLQGMHGQGEKVVITKNWTGQSEAIQVVNDIVELHEDHGIRYDEMAVLYRMNHLSLNFEQALSGNAIPYVVYGGQKFFDRAEIQDALGYLKLLVNMNDDDALSRVINMPPRRIGPKVQEQLRQIAREQQCSLGSAMMKVAQCAAVPGATSVLVGLANKIEVFLQLMQKLDSIRSKGSLSEVVRAAVMETGLYDYYKAQDEKEAHNSSDNLRYRNLEELISNAVSFENGETRMEIEEIEPLEGTVAPAADPLQEFLYGILLTSAVELPGDGRSEAAAPDRVNLMSIHAAKGLEFRVVFLVCFEENILPSSLALKDQDSRSYDAEEEERRLAYVAITRARERLYLSYANERIMYGYTWNNGASPFLYEMVNFYKKSGIPPEELPYEIREGIWQGDDEDDEYYLFRGVKHFCCPG